MGVIGEPFWRLRILLGVTWLLFGGEMFICVDWRSGMTGALILNCRRFKVSGYPPLWPLSLSNTQPAKESRDWA